MPIPAVSTKDCAVVKSCFRYCTGYSGSDCQAHTARYTAAMEFTAAKTGVKFTLGGLLADEEVNMNFFYSVFCSRAFI